MRLSRLHQFSLVLAALGSSAAFVACGGGGGGGGGGGAHPDAKEFLDAKVFLDAPPGLQGLGQKCAAIGSNAPDCPADAPDCLGIALSSTTNSTFYCSPECDTGASGKTNGSGQLTTVTPAPGTQCTTAYSGGTAATPACGLILATTPADNPLKANTNYTGIVLGCVIECGGAGMTTCPTGLTCNTTAKLCFPN